MAGTRSSSRLAAQSSSTCSSHGETSSSPVSSGMKRNRDSDMSPSAKRGKTASKKKQKTLEETMESNDATSADKDIEDIKKETYKPSAIEHDVENGEDDAPKSSTSGTAGSKDVEIDDFERDGERAGDGSSTDDAGKAETEESKPGQSREPSNGAVEPTAREDETPASIMEKGVIYFFFRGRVGIDHPSAVNEIARSYIVLRPLPHGAKLSEGEIGDAGNCRLLALPKKVLPGSGRDRFMVFVEKTQQSFEDLKENFLRASDYATKTAGTRHSPAATPVGEGIYAITSTGRQSHLAYILTLPAELDEVQQDIGLRERGSFITSTKNPSHPSPANAGLPKGAEYPAEIIDEFGGLKWAPLQPKYLEYVNAQILLIGESHGLDKGTQPQPQDQKEGKEEPLEEMERLEGEDEIRVRHLKGDDAVFADLHLSANEYPRLRTAW